MEVFGGKVVRAGRLMHGKTSIIQHDGHTLFEGLPQPCEVGRYHSLIAAPETLPPTAPLAKAISRNSSIRSVLMPQAVHPYYREAVRAITEAVASG